MKTINTTKGLQLKEVSNKIAFILDKNIIMQVPSSILNEYSMIASAERVKKSICKKYFREHYDSKIETVGGIIKTITLYCNEDDYKYKEQINFVIDYANNRFIEL